MHLQKEIKGSVLVTSHLFTSNASTSIRALRQVETNATQAQEKENIDPSACACVEVVFTVHEINTLMLVALVKARLQCTQSWTAIREFFLLAEIHCT